MSAWWATLGIDPLPNIQRREPQNPEEEKFVARFAGFAEEVISSSSGAEFPGVGPSLAGTGSGSRSSGSEGSCEILPVSPVQLFNAIAPCGRQPAPSPVRNVTIIRTDPNGT